MMIIWGGGGSAEGAAYDPVTDRWRELAPSPLSARSGHAAVWTGEEMIIWGGCCGDGAQLADGAALGP